MAMESATLFANDEDESDRTPLPHTTGAQGPYKSATEDGKSLDQLKKYFDDYRALTQRAREESLIDYDFYDGYQWTPDEVTQLKLRKQPPIVINRTRVAINGFLGVVEKSRSDPKCWPRKPGDEDAADVATDTLVYVYDHTRFLRKKVEGFKDFLIGGTMAAIVEVDKKKNPVITKIRWEEYFCDPRSRELDHSDARYEGCAKWMYVDDVYDIYPEKKEELEQTLASGSPGVIDQSFQDRPLHNMWIDGQNRRLMVVEIYYKNRGKWYRCVYHSNGILEDGLSPYKDEDGEPSNAIISCVAYMDRENQTYGLVRDMRDVQREINKRRSKLLHLLSTAQIEASDPGAVEVDADTARMEAARPDGVIPYGWKKVSTTDMSAGQFQLLSESKSEIERMGPNPAVLGRQGADASGKAVLARQQAGLTEVGIIFGQADDWELRIYRACWARCKQFWNAERWVRVTKDPDSPTFVGLNVPKGPTIPVKDPATGQIVVNPATGPDGQPHPQAGEPQTAEGPPEFDQQGESIHGYKNEVALMDIDIKIDTSPETANIMAEMFHDIISLLQASPVYAEQIPFDLVMELSPMPHKRQVMARIKAELAQKQQGAEAAAAKKAQLDEMQQNAEVGNIESRTLKNEAQAHSMALDAVGTGKSILAPPNVQGPTPDGAGA